MGLTVKVGPIYIIILKEKPRMLQKIIKFENFEGKEVERTCYFNLMKSEIMELEMSTTGGLAEMIQRSSKPRMPLRSSLCSRNSSCLPMARRILMVNTSTSHLRSPPALPTLWPTQHSLWNWQTNADAATAFVNGIVQKQSS